MLGQVITWYMTEEERLEYIKKHPIKPQEKPKGTGYTNVYNPEYKWPATRKKKVADSRWEK